MSAPTTEVVERLERLAAHAPSAGVDPATVWAQGRRRQGRRWVAVAAAAVVLAGVGAVGAAPLARLADPPVATPPDGAGLVLPDLVREPGSWEPAYGEAPGPLTAVGTAQRSSLTSTTPALWGVSAVNGESRFLDLPDATVDSGTPAALTTDGRTLAYWFASPGDDDRAIDGDRPATGVAVLDLVTGEEERWDAGAGFGLATAELVWAGDVLWFTGGAYRDAGRDSWRVKTWVWPAGGDPVLASVPRGFRLADAQPTPDGLVLHDASAARRIRVTAADAPPATIRLVHDGLTQGPLLSPDGRRVAGRYHDGAGAFDSAPGRLLVGAVDRNQAEMEDVHGVRVQSVLGWRSPTEIVVGSQEHGEDDPATALRAWSVDVVTGEKTRLLDFSGNVPSFAAEAWTGKVVDAPPAPFAPDPRLVALGGAVVITFSVSLWRSIRGRRGHP